MRGRRRLAVFLTLAGLLAETPGSAAEEPAVARARYRVGNEILTAGTVFFLVAPRDLGVVAVGAAHSFDLDKLPQAPEVELRLGRTNRRVGFASRFLVPPGRPFRAPGGRLRDDFVILRLDRPSAGVRALEPERGEPPGEGDRVRILGIPSAIPRDEDDIFGTLRIANDERVEVDLDVPQDLRGWGGAPVLSHRSGRVVGILQAAWPSGSTLRVAASPIAAILEALDRPLEAGRGKPFSAFARAERRASAAPADKRSRSESRDSSASTTGSRRVARRPLLPAPVRPAAQPVWVQIEHPLDGAIVGDPLGAFVAGRALAPRGDFRSIDVVLVLDTSGSTSQPTGVDVNGNGVVGRHRGPLAGFFGVTDPGDSVLAAEVAAARQLLRSLDPRSTRVGLVSFAGHPPDSGGLFGRSGAAAIAEVPLTREYERIEKALDRILERGAEGSTHMAAGVDQATIELLGLRGSISEPDPESEKAVLFLTDGQPTLPYGPTFKADNVTAVFRAADRAARFEIRVHTFGIGEEALEGPVAIVELAARTRGIFTPVRHPGSLVDVIETVDFANVDEIRVHNATTGEAADPVFKSPDGAFSTLVPLRGGRNRIEVVARASDGSEAKETVTVTYVPGNPEPPVPQPLLAQRNRLLERRLIELRRGRVTAERERAEQARKELLVEIERERAKAHETAGRQRKELELEVEEADPR